MKEQWLTKVAEKHQDWIGIAASFVGNSEAENIVQKMYINLDRWADERIIKKDGEVNRCYVYLSIRTLCFMYFKEQKKVGELPEDGSSLEELASEAYEEYDIEKDLAWQLIIDNTHTLIDSWRWYDKTLFILYRDSTFSLRGLAKETGISWMSIHSTVKNCKDIIRNTFQEDYEDFKNGEYHLIKPFKIK